MTPVTTHTPARSPDMVTTPAPWTFDAALAKLPRVDAAGASPQCPGCGEWCAELLDLRVLPANLRAHRSTACVDCCRRLVEDGHASSVAWLAALRTPSARTTTNPNPPECTS
jgi:hypothetical protein